jgi:hypothetical protein
MLFRHIQLFQNLSSHMYDLSREIIEEGARYNADQGRSRVSESSLLVNAVKARNNDPRSHKSENLFRHCKTFTRYPHLIKISRTETDVRRRYSEKTTRFPFLVVFRTI